MTVLIISFVAALIIFAAVLVTTICINSGIISDENRKELDDEQMSILKEMYERTKHDS